jgi:hypothetical protein
MGGGPAELAPLHRHHPESHPTERDACRIAVRPSHGQTLTEARLGPRRIVLVHGQQPEPDQCVAPQQRRRVTVPRQGLL